jgi:NAD(P) transhydrogenase
MVTLNGELKWPPPPIITSASELAKPTSNTHDKKKAVVVDPYKAGVNNAVSASAAIIAALALGYTGPHPEFIKMLNTFVLSGIVGYQVVWGVAPALHSPLMSVTNAVSGIIIVGGMMVMNGGYFPADFPGFLAATSVAIASLNIFGGFLIT